MRRASGVVTGVSFFHKGNPCSGGFSPPPISAGCGIQIL